MGRRIAIALALAGCNQVFGLRSTELATPDASPCWEPTQTALDEDADGIADGCDVCPGEYDPLQIDSDGDGVGDACDPHSDAATEHLVFFDGFARDPIDPAWHAFTSTGSWSQSAGAARQTIAAASGALILRRQFTNATVALVMTDQLQPASPTLASVAGVYVRIPLTGEGTEPTGVLCHSYLSIPNGHAIKVEEIGGTGAYQSGERTVPDGAVTHVRLTSTGECVAHRDAQANVAPSLSPLATPVPGEVALYVTNTTASFQSITVIETDL